MKSFFRTSAGSKTTRGFTLIELLVVIAIIGMLSSIVLASLNSARMNSRNAFRTQTVTQLRTAFTLALTSGATIPTTAPTYGCLSTTCPWGYSHLGMDTFLAPYISLSPDPTGSKSYYGILIYGPYDSGWDPYPPKAGSFYIYWSAERSGQSSSTVCAPGFVYYNNASQYPNDIFCVLRVND